MDLAKNKKELNDNGFTIIDSLYSLAEIDQIKKSISQTETARETFRKSAGLFAIRQFLKEIPNAASLIFNHNLNAIIQKLAGESYFLVKSIYFDKPETSNWFVAYHQDLTISVDKKANLQGFVSWTLKHNQFAVQPPLYILQNIITVCIHLDEADENNGALHVVPKSHLKNICRPETVDWSNDSEVVCKVSTGGVMVMKPLLFHRSSKSTSNKRRRVIHLEFSNLELPQEIKWAERMNIFHRQSSIIHPTSPPPSSS